LHWRYQRYTFLEAFPWEILAVISPVYSQRLKNILETVLYFALTYRTLPNFDPFWLADYAASCIGGIIRMEAFPWELSVETSPVYSPKLKNILETVLYFCPNFSDSVVLDLF